MSSTVRRCPREDEKLCVEAFKRWLRAEYPHCRVSDWIPGDEPPDFWLPINGCKHAVEVTQVCRSVPIASTDDLSTPDPHRTDSERAAGATTERLLDEVRQALARDGLPHGVYVVDAGPAILDITVRKDDSKERKKVVKKRRSELERQIAAYVRHTSNVCKAPRKALFAREEEEEDDMDIGEYSMGIAKYGTWTDIIDCAPGELYGPVQVVADIKEAVEERARTKDRKLRGLSDPVVLLLLVTDLRAEPRHLDEAVASLPDKALPGNFEAVFLVSRCGDECRLLRCAPSFLSGEKRGHSR